MISDAGVNADGDQIVARTGAVWHPAGMGGGHVAAGDEGRRRSVAITPRDRENGVNHAICRYAWCSTCSWWHYSTDILSRGVDMHGAVARHTGCNRRIEHGRSNNCGGAAYTDKHRTPHLSENESYLPMS